MKVTFADFGYEIASSRLRANIPQRELAKRGITRGQDVLVYSKSWLTDDEIAPFAKRVYDVCDDHYQTPDLMDYYVKHTLEADLVTCNSEVMRNIIKRETMRDAIVIREPYEGGEGEPNIGPRLFWFGHSSNYNDVRRLNPLRPLLTMGDHPECDVPWTADNWRTAIASKCIVVIPTGRSMAKSENRMVESIRAGRYVCAEYLPAYEPFYRFFPCMDINEHVDMILDDQRAAIEAISEAQDYIRDRYAPQTIANEWLTALEML